MRAISILCVVLILCQFGLGAGSLPQSSNALRPVDLCVVGNRVWVACETGWVVEIDAGTGETVARHRIEGVPSAIHAFEGTVWVADAAAGQLVALHPQEQASRGVVVKAVPDLADFAIQGQTFWAVGRWSRQVVRGALAGSSDGTAGGWTVNLDFSPGQIRYLDAENVLVVLDAFGDSVRVLDAADGRIVNSFAFFGHRIRGIVDDPDGRRIVVSHQMLNPTAQSTRGDIHWGMAMSNDVRWLDRHALINESGDDIYRGGRIDPVGVVGNGGADPNDLVITSDGTVAVPLGGTNEVAVGLEEEFEFERVRIGINPVAAALARDQKSVWVACRLDDTLWQIDLEDRKVERRIALSDPLAVTPEMEGERLFHSASLSHDQWMTCASCHPAGHAINERADNLGDGDFGAPKRILSLLGRSDTAPFGWTGRDATLEAQIRRSIKSTMNGPASGGYDPDAAYYGGDDVAGAVVEKIARFIRALQPPPAVDAVTGRSDRQLIARGQQLFTASGCADCHTPGTYTSSGLYDVGLEDENGRTEFNPPSLVGVGQRGPRYLHDLRASSLAAVFEEFDHQLNEPLEPAELEALLAFLRSL